MPPNGRQRSRDWVWTLNNYTADEEEKIRDLVEGGHATFVIYGRELGEGGTPHLQGFLQLENRSSLATVKALPGLQRAHFETRRGTVEEAIEYCKKEGDHHSFGISKSQGKRSDLDKVRDAIKEGVPDSDLWESNFGAMVRYKKSFGEYRAQLNRRDPAQSVQILVLWGPTGHGKSRFPRIIDPDVFSIPDITLRWWDGYQGQKNILLDDFDGKDVPVGSFLRYMDRYEVSVPIKGGFVPLNASRIWITSNTNPDDWFPNEIQAKRDAVRRRLTRVVHLDAPIRFEHQDDVDHVKILLNLN